jgi:hypothetical protein
MSIQTLSVGDIVQVQILTSPTLPAAKGFGVGLIVGSNMLPLEDRIHVYTSLAGVAVDFATNTEEYLAATAYFAQKPAPQQLMIGNRFASAVAGHLRGSTLIDQVIADWQAVTSGGFSISINGTLHQITGLNFSADTTMAQVAATIQTALAAALASTTCTWTGTYLLITSPTTGTSSTVSFAGTPSSGTDISTMMGGTLASGANSVTGIAAETMTGTLQALQLFNAGWYGLALTTAASTQDVKDAAAFAETALVEFWTTSNDPNCALASSTSDIAYFLKNLGYNKTNVFYDSANADSYLAVSAMARMAIVDYTQPNSITTLAFKSAPGFAPSPITETQKLALDGKNCNYYASFGGFSMFYKGRSANGRPIDEVIALDWLDSTLQAALFSVLASSPTKIPQTDKGVQQLVHGAQAQAFEPAVNNGLLAPGVWNGQSLGNINSGDLLPKGYYVFASPVASQSSADRAARKAPPISAIGCGAGAIESCALTFTFQS